MGTADGHDVTRESQAEVMPRGANPHPHPDPNPNPSPNPLYKVMSRGWREEQARLHEVALSHGGGLASATYKVNRKYTSEGDDPFADAAGLDTHGVAAARSLETG